MKHITKQQLFNQRSGTNYFQNTTVYTPGNPTGNLTRLTSPAPLNAHPSVVPKLLFYINSNAEAHMELPHTLTKKHKTKKKKERRDRHD